MVDFEKISSAPIFRDGYVLYYIISYYIVLYCIVSCRVVSFRVASRRVASHHITSYYITFYFIISYYIISYYIITSYHIISYYITANTHHAVTFMTLVHKLTIITENTNQCFILKSYCISLRVCLVSVTGNGHIITDPIISITPQRINMFNVIFHL